MLRRAASRRRCIPANTRQWAGFDGLDASNYFTTSPGTGIVGQQAGFHVQAWMWFETTAVNSTKPIIDTVGGTPANRGWRFATGTTNTTLNFGCYDTSTSTTKTSPSWTVVTGRPVHVVGMIRSNAVRLFVDGVQVGTGTAIATFGTATSPIMTVGRRMQDTNSVVGTVRVLGGIAGGHYAPSDAEVLAAYQAGLSGKTVSHISGGTAQAQWLFQRGSVPASIAATVGSDVLTTVGAPTSI